MKKLFLTVATLAALGTPGHAADMAVKAPPPAASPAYSWTGFYVGGNVGYGWQDPTVTFTPNDVNANSSTCTGAAFGGICPPAAAFNIAGALGGLQGGYNLQINQNWLLGIETDFDWSRIRGAGASNFAFTFFLGPPGVPANFQASQNVDWFGTVRGRLGFLPSNNLLIYTTGGFAYGLVKENVALNTLTGLSTATGGFSFNCITGSSGCFIGSSSRIDTGWTLGAGGEYALWNNTSVRLEYLYVNLGRGDAVNVVAQATQFGPPTTPSSFTATYSTLNFHVVRAGLNWRF